MAEEAEKPTLGYNYEELVEIFKATFKELLIKYLMVKANKLKNKSIPRAFVEAFREEVEND